jgi:hypothetical protein
MSLIDAFGIQLIDEKVDFYLRRLYSGIWKSKMVEVHDLYSRVIKVYLGPSCSMVYRGMAFGDRDINELKYYFQKYHTRDRDRYDYDIHNVNNSYMDWYDNSMPVAQLPLRYLYSSGDYQKNMYFDSLVIINFEEMSSIDVFGVQLIDENVDFYLTRLYWRIWKSKMVNVHELYSDMVKIIPYDGLPFVVIYKRMLFGNRDTDDLKSYYFQKYRALLEIDIHNTKNPDLSVA